MFTPGTPPNAYKNTSPFWKKLFPSLLAPHPALRPSLFVMKFTTVFAVLATLATAVSATFSNPSLLDTNAKRFAAGLPPLPPARRSLGTPTYGM